MSDFINSNPPANVGQWVSWVSARLAVALVASVALYATARVVNSVDRDTLQSHTKTVLQEHRDQAWQRFDDHEKRISETERTGRESRNLLIELRTKMDIVLDRVAPER